MSERLRKAYELKEERRIQKLMEMKTACYMARMRLAGEKFKLAHPDHFVVK